MKRNIIIGIDASRNRSGGAVNYLKGILEEVDISYHSIGEIHIWGQKNLLSNIVGKSFIIKHSHPLLERSLIFQIYWQMFLLPKLLRRNNCDILFTADASSVCKFKPEIVLSQDLLSYEPGILDLYKFSRKKLRLYLIYYLQNWAFRRALAVIFLTKYASCVIQKFSGKLNNITYIPHGVDEDFKNINYNKEELNLKENISFTYTSPIEKYKNHKILFRAIKILNDKGFEITLNLIGAIDLNYQSELLNIIKKNKLETNSIKFHGHLNKKDLIKIYEKTDIFLFPSKCETFGISLLEAMSFGLPIACSNKSSLPETLRDGGIYFDPDDQVSVANSIEKLIHDSELRNVIKSKARELAKNYTWKKCSYQTFNFICKEYNRYRNEFKNF
tara:strand:+ start:17281 stop:18441 length:1161 start_codon:yes stop_codon:yes gene_type:complete